MNFNPQTIEQMQARLPAVFERVLGPHLEVSQIDFDFHTFDFDDGMRFIIDKEPTIETLRPLMGEMALHISAAMLEESLLSTCLSGKKGLIRFIQLAQNRMGELLNCTPPTKPTVWLPEPHWFFKGESYEDQG
jgi:hypothetical protein